MMEIPDHIYQRSVIKQLYLKEESRHLFQKNAYSVSISREERESGYRAEAVEILHFKEEPVLKEEDLNGILRKLICAGGELKELRVEIIFFGGFEENQLRQFSISLKTLADSLAADIKRVSVQVKEGRECEKTVVISGRGPLKPPSAAPWQRGRIFENEDIVLSGSLGKYGAAELFRKNKKDLELIYPKLYLERLGRKVADRLPLIEAENLSFYETTAMQPLGAGGLLAGLWNIGDREEAGLVIYADRLSYAQETIELSNHFNLNPLELNSSGAYLIATFRGEELTYTLRKAGIDATCIGRVIEDKKRVIVFEDEERFIESPKYIF